MVVFKFVFTGECNSCFSLIFTHHLPILYTVTMTFACVYEQSLLRNKKVMDNNNINDTKTKIKPSALFFELPSM